MIFVQKAASPSFPYPTALTQSGFIISYPISGSTQTNPTNLSRSVARTRSRKVHSYWGAPVWPLDMFGSLTYARAELQVARWLAQYWKYVLTDAQRAAWYALQQTALASAQPPKSWGGATYKAKGWPLFWLFNKVASQDVQDIFTGIVPSVPVPVPDAPSTWDPLYLSNVSFTLSIHADILKVWCDNPHNNTVWYCVYAGFPTRLAGRLHPPKVASMGIADSYTPSSHWPANPWFYAQSPQDMFPTLQAGQQIALTLRRVNPDDWTPSNFTPWPPQNIVVQP